MIESVLLQASLRRQWAWLWSCHFQPRSAPVASFSGNDHPREERKRKSSRDGTKKSDHFRQREGRGPGFLNVLCILLQHLLMMFSIVWLRVQTLGATHRQLFTKTIILQFCWQNNKITIISLIISPSISLKKFTVIKWH